VLTGLGFHRDDWTRRTEEFSGGWQMRIGARQTSAPETQPAAARRTHQPP